MIVELSLSFQEYGGENLRRTYRLRRDFVAIPRIGEDIEITDGGWTETVRDVTWMYNGDVLIGFGPHVTGDDVPRTSSLPYAALDELPALAAAGWVET